MSSLPTAAAKASKKRVAPTQRGGAAQRRIHNIEKGIFKLESTTETIDAEMIKKGFELAALLQLQAKRDAASARIHSFMSEWEELVQNGCCRGGAEKETQGFSENLVGEGGQGGLNSRGRKKQATSAPIKPATGGKGRVVLNHSTHIPQLIDVLGRLVDMHGIFTLVPGQLSR